MNYMNIMNFLIESADSDYETIMPLFKNQKYSWILFFGQLVIEKLLKELYAKYNKNNPHAPRSHDLIYLLKIADLNLTKCQEKY